MSYENNSLHINEATKRIELDVEGMIAFIDYKRKGDTLFLIHTEVPKELEGRGVGQAIIQKTLTYARSNNFKIVPLCTFVQFYLKKHPEWSDIVAERSEGSSIDKSDN